MRRSASAFVLVAGSLAAVAPTGAMPERIPPQYSFSFTVASKPDVAAGLEAVKVTGSGSGSFSIRDRRVDRDGTFYWQLANATGRVSFSAGGKVFLRATVSGGTFGTEKTSSGLDRDARLELTITSSTLLRCSSPNAEVGLEDHRLATSGDREGMVLDGCSSSLQWDGRPPGLVVSVRPA
jgi:hypothetical protein